MTKIYPLLFAAITITNLYSMQSLHQDDINSPTCWVENPSNPNPVWLPSLPIHNSAITINQRHFYRPATINDVKDLIVCAFIHDQALEQNNNYQEHFAAVKRFATWYATIKHKNLELLSCQCTEPWSDNKQVKAGEQLQNILTQYYPNAETVLFGHSNGANISNYVSRITPAEKPIDLMVHLSCPRKRSDNYQPLHYKNLLYFFSDNDGANIPYDSHIFDQARWTIYWACALPFFITGIALEACNMPPAPVAPFIYGLSKIPPEKDPIISEGSHDFLDINDKVTVGFRTQINANNPTNTMEIASLLPEIIEEALQYHSYNYSNSKSFYLNIGNNNKIYLSRRSKKLNQSSFNIPNTIDYLVRNNHLNNILNTDDISRKDIRAQGIYSEQIKYQYKNDYGKHIEESSLTHKPPNTYISNCVTFATIYGIMLLIYKLFFSKKKKITKSLDESDNDEQSENSNEFTPNKGTTHEITAADIFNNFVLTTQPL